MIDLVIPAPDFETVRAALLTGPAEACAVLFASGTKRDDGMTRLLVRDFRLAAEKDYSHRARLSAELKPEFVALVSKQARRQAMSLVFVHSHPGAEPPSFSATDNEGEHHLATFLQRRNPSTHAALVLSNGGVRARRLGTNLAVRVISLGARRDVLFDPDATSTSPAETFDRQVRAFGQSGQRALQSLRVAIVGLGGTGSIVAQQLVHLGVRDLTLVDPDVVEATNLNRVANATSSDIGSPKVDVSSRYILAVAPGAKVNKIVGDIIRVRTARELTNADVIFGCTDSHGSRAVLQHIAYQYLVPCIDMGTTIVAARGQVTHIYGRVQQLAPGLGCFTCSGLLDSNEVRRDMMTAFERKQDPYIDGAREPAPSVMSLNGTVASLAVTMLLSVVAGVPGDARYILYNAKAPSLRAIRTTRAPNCFVCSRDGAFARGDSWEIPGRRD